jgi:hypothetical protein
MTEAREPFPAEVPDIADDIAAMLVRHNMEVVRTLGPMVGLKLTSAYRPKNIETGREADLVLNFEDLFRGGDVKVELDFRIHNPR